MSAKPEEHKSWSFASSLSVEGDGIDSMVNTSNGAKAMREAVGAEAFDKFSAIACLEHMLRYCQQSGLLPLPDNQLAARTRPPDTFPLDTPAAAARQPLLHDTVRGRQP